jgi:hypothetical protein
MKKIITISESDLKRIVKRVVEEQDGDKNIKFRSAINWLNTKFNDLTKIPFGSKIYYVDKKDTPLLFYYPDPRLGGNFVFVNHKKLWEPLKNIFYISDLQVQKILRLWIEETYNLTGFVPMFKESMSIGDKEGYL